MKFSRHCPLSTAALMVSVALTSGSRLSAQGRQPETIAGSANVNATLNELQSQVRELKDLVLELQQQTTASRAEVSRLRQELESQRAQSQALGGTAESSQSSAAAMPLEQRLDHLQEDDQLLSAKIDQQQQTKLESASKYRVRFSGVVLFNMFSNTGAVENWDVPTWATRKDPMDSVASTGGTLRQSILGFEVFGPEVFGARSR